MHSSMPVTRASRPVPRSKVHHRAPLRALPRRTISSCRPNLRVTSLPRGALSAAPFAQFSSSSAQPSQAPVTTDSQSSPDEVQNQNDAPEKKKKDKAPRSWLQIYSDITLRQLSGALPTKVSKNDARIKARNDYMKDFLSTTALIKKILPQHSTPSSEVWLRVYGQKEPPRLVPFSEAERLATESGEFHQVTCMRSATQRPAKPDNMAAVPDDGILPVWIMDSREYLQELYRIDTDQAKGGSVKEIQVNTTITNDDLQRKLQQCIDFLFDGCIVKISCQNKSLKQLQTLVEKNTHLDPEALREQAEDVLLRGKALDVSSMAKGAQKPSTFNAQGAERHLRSKHIQQKNETDQAYNLRIQGLVQQEQTKHNSKSDSQGRQVARIQQHITSLSQSIRKLEESLKNAKDHAAKQQSESNKRDKKKKVTGSSQDNLAMTQMQAELDTMNAELAQWRKKLTAAQRGENVSLQIRRPGASGGAGGEADDDAGFDDFETGGGDGGSGGADSDHETHGGGGDYIAAEDDAANAEKKRKLTKRQLETEQQRTMLLKMSTRDKVAYLAGAMSNQQYPVMGQLTESIGRISCIIMQERQARKKSGEVLDFDEMDAEKLSKLSKKDRRRYEARLAATKEDPNAALKLEISNAVTIMHKGGYVYNDAILEKQLVKPFWCNHDGGSPDQASGKKQISFSLSKSAVNPGK